MELVFTSITNTQYKEFERGNSQCALQADGCGLCGPRCRRVSVD